MSKIEIREFRSGEFQVWKDNEVLRPYHFTWYPHYHSKLNFFFFKEKKEALKQIKMTLDKESCVKVHKVSIELEDLTTEKGKMSKKKGTEKNSAPRPLPVNNLITKIKNTIKYYINDETE